jgi:hypothetical protein
LKFGLLVKLQKPEEDDSRKDAKHAKVHQIPLFHPLSKGDKRGISGFLARLASWREKLS